MSLTIALRSTATVLAALILGGCVPTSPNFDRHFGDTVPALRAQQTKNPNAPVANQDKSVDGLDGRAAREAVERYHKSFSEPPAPVNTFVIGVGSGASGGAGGAQ